MYKAQADGAAQPGTEAPEDNAESGSEGDDVQDVDFEEVK